MAADAIPADGRVMAAVAVRNIPDEVHRALKGRAAANGRSTEAEIREILRLAVAADRAGLSDRLAAVEERHGVADFDVVREPSEPEPAQLP